MLQRDNRLHTCFTTCRDAVGIGIHRSPVKRRRRAGRVCEAWLHTRPLDAQTKGIEPHASSQIEVGAIPIPEIHRASGAIDSA